MVSREYSPEEARNSANALIAVITVFVLNWICNLDEEVEIMARTGLNIPIVVYYFSRAASLVYCTWTALIYAGLVGSDIPRTSLVISTAALSPPLPNRGLEGQAVLQQSRLACRIEGTAFQWPTLIIFLMFAGKCDDWGLVVGAFGENWLAGCPIVMQSGCFTSRFPARWRVACRVFRMLLLWRRGVEDWAISARAVESMIMAVLAGPEARGAAGASDVGLVYQSVWRDRCKIHRGGKSTV
ncbi:hypothetical protein FIBSPDRAFT_932134 [Athelia psychrophila]|uniref:Uncharacterized protein n=1 Tax=Athelia psychrophila TaxID=1759441 RepID=A0A166JAY2_9AGAM|nr:hypothetical protein FIBSPDRAFT_932134 [Fibularhizoctonia sp. CBS 109695]